jgi:hypothetical protein
MTYRLMALLGALMATVSPLAAACPDGTMPDPAKVASAIDRYAEAPFSARTWRVLKGLGDPMIEMSYPGSDRWDDERRFKELAAQVLPDAPVPDYISYECRIGYPLQELEKRIAVLGAGHDYVKQWLRVQLAVFAACGGADVAELPPALDIKNDLRLIQEADRAYQQATLIFYKDKAQSLDLFRTIGQSTSPHRAASRYMVANILANAKQLDQARAEANAILADKSLASVHEITQELLGYIANLEDTAPGWTSLLNETIDVIELPAANILASPKLRADYARALYDIDYAGIRAKRDDSWLDGTLPENPTISKAIVDLSRQKAIVPWMIAGQTANDYYNRASWQYVGPKWEERTRSYVGKAANLAPDLPPLARDAIESLQARPDPAERKALWDKARAAAAAAEASCGNAAETAAAAVLLLNAVRVSALGQDFAEAYAGLEAFPAKTSKAYANAVVALGKYLVGEGLLEEGRRYRDRLLTSEFLTSLDTADKDTTGQLMMWLAEDDSHWASALATQSRKTDLAVMNFLPAKQLRALSQDEQTFSAAERALLSRAAWTRVYARGGLPDAKFTEELFALNPELKEIADKTAADYPKAKSDQIRLLTILRTPRYNILVNGPGGWQPLSMTDPGAAGAIDAFDHNDKNWWCPFEPDRNLLALRDEFDSVSGNGIAEWNTQWLAPVVDSETKPMLDAKREKTLKGNPGIKDIGWKEIASLSNMPSAPKRLTDRAIAWGKRSKGDDGAPEALALAVKTTRYGCDWHGGHGRYSKAAQELLQKKFAGTSWAAQTPYWFDCMDQEWPSDPNATEKVATCKPKTWPKQKLPR